MYVDIEFILPRAKPVHRELDGFCCEPYVQSRDHFLLLLKGGKAQRDNSSWIIPKSSFKLSSKVEKASFVLIMTSSYFFSFYYFFASGHHKNHWTISTQPTKLYFFFKILFAIPKILIAFQIEMHKLWRFISLLRSYLQFLLYLRLEWTNS